MFAFGSLLPATDLLQSWVCDLGVLKVQFSLCKMRSKTQSLVTTALFL